MKIIIWSKMCTAHCNMYGRNLTIFLYIFFVMVYEIINTFYHFALRNKKIWNNIFLVGQNISKSFRAPANVGVGMFNVNNLASLDIRGKFIIYFPKYGIMCPSTQGRSYRRISCINDTGTPGCGDPHVSI